MSETRLAGPRITREKLTVTRMLEMYCLDKHGTQSGFCADCQILHDYAMARLMACPFNEYKTVCAKCTVHCYQPAMKEKMKEVMRYAGPRMMFSHPMLAIRHTLDGMKPPRNPGGAKTG